MKSSLIDEFLEQGFHASHKGYVQLPNQKSVWHLHLHQFLVPLFIHLDLHSKPEVDYHVFVDLAPDVHHREYEGGAKDGKTHYHPRRHQTHRIEQQHDDVVRRRPGKVTW